MTLRLTVVAQDPARETFWVGELRKALGGMADIVLHPATMGSRESDQVVFVDAEIPGLAHALKQIDRRGKAIFLLVRDGDSVPVELTEGLADDVLVHPIRHVEILSRLNHYRQLLMWDEVAKLNHSFEEMVLALREDLKLAENLQKMKLPVRFPELKGIKFASRYLAGMRAGGDHFDVADANDGSRFSLVMSDSSSYGLSSAVLGVLMKVAMKLSADEARSCHETVRRIHEELLVTLTEKDKLSLFYGTVSRKDLSLRYLNLGTSCAFYSNASKPFVLLPSQSDAITRSGVFPGKDLEVALQLEPGDRLALISDGFVETAGGAEKTRELLDRFKGGNPVDALNELVYSVKSKFTEPDDMPAQDCSALIVDVDAKVIRLAK
jgi:hypothetical protein